MAYRNKIKTLTMVQTQFLKYSKKYFQHPSPAMPNINPRILLEHVSTPPLWDPHHLHTCAFSTEGPRDAAPPNSTAVQSKRLASPHVESEQLRTTEHKWYGIPKRDIAYDQTCRGSWDRKPSSGPLEPVKSLKRGTLRVRMESLMISEACMLSWPNPGPGKANFHLSGPMHFPPSAWQWEVHPHSRNPNENQIMYARFGLRHLHLSTSVTKLLQIICNWKQWNKHVISRTSGSLFFF